MPGPKELLGCFPVSIHFLNFLTTSFCHFSQFSNFTPSFLHSSDKSSPPKNSDDIFLVISSNFYLQFYTSFRIPPYCLLIFNHLPLLLTFTYTFFQKTPSLDAPQLDARGRGTHPHPSLHATGNMWTSTKKI